jgi:hypothetical protein
MRICLGLRGPRCIRCRPMRVPERVWSLQQIVDELIEQIGKEAWLKLSYQGKRQLQDAESLWSSMHMKLGRGSGDFGLVATAYVKVFEGEILERLRPMTATQAFHRLL